MPQHVDINRASLDPAHTCHGKLTLLQLPYWLACLCPSIHVFVECWLTLNSWDGRYVYHHKPLLRLSHEHQLAAFPSLCGVGCTSLTCLKQIAVCRARKAPSSWQSSGTWDNKLVQVAQNPEA